MNLPPKGSQSLGDECQALPSQALWYMEELVLITKWSRRFANQDVILVPDIYGLIRMVRARGAVASL